MPSKLLIYRKDVPRTNTMHKWRHYVLPYILHLIALDDPTKYIMSRPLFSSRLAKWALPKLRWSIFSRNQLKANSYDFLADHPVPVEWEIFEDLPNEKAFLVDI